MGGGALSFPLSGWTENARPALSREAQGGVWLFWGGRKK